MLKKAFLFATFLICIAPVTSACLSSNQISLITQLALKNNLSVEDSVNLFESICNTATNAQTIALEVNDNLTQEIADIYIQMENVSLLSQRINETNTSLSKKIDDFINNTNETFVKKDTFIQSNNVLMHTIDVVNASLNANLAQWLDAQIEEALKTYPTSKNFSALKDEVDTRFENYNKNLDNRVNLLGTQLTKNITLELIDIMPEKQTSAIWLSILGVVLAGVAIGFTAWHYQKTAKLNQENLEAIKTGAKVTYKTIYDNTKDWEDHLVQLRTQILKDKELDKHAKIELMKQIDRAVIQNEEDVQKYAEQYKLMKKEGINLSELKEIKDAVTGKKRK